jgi:hypothetical protein
MIVSLIVFFRDSLEAIGEAQGTTHTSPASRAHTFSREVFMDDYELLATVITGTGAERTVVSATLPSNIRSMPCRPVVPMTTA